MFGRSKRKLRKMGRRRFLKRLAEMGAGGAALYGMDFQTFDEVVDDPDDEVPRVHHYWHVETGTTDGSPEKDAEYYTIDRDRWERVEAASKAAKRLERSYRRRGISDVTVGIDGSRTTQPHVTVTYNEHPQLVVTDRDTGETQRIDGTRDNVDLTGVDDANVDIEEVWRSPDAAFDKVRAMPDDTLSAEVGDAEYATTVDGIDVEVKRSETIRYGEYYSEEYRPIPGSCKNEITKTVFTEEGTFGIHTGPLCGDTITTAGHIATSVGDAVYQPDRPNVPRNSVGETDEVEWDDGAGGVLKFDGAVCLIDEAMVTPDIAAQNGTYFGYNFGGVYGWDAIQDYATDSFPNPSFNCQGISSGLNTCEIVEIESESEKTFRSDNDEGEPGDSGGPIWRGLGAEEFIGAGSVNGGIPDVDTVYTAFTEYENRFDVTFPSADVATNC